MMWKRSVIVVEGFGGFWQFWPLFSIVSAFLQVAFYVCGILAFVKYLRSDRKAPSGDKPTEEKPEEG
jgi:hypothetical protein